MPNTSLVRAYSDLLAEPEELRDLVGEVYSYMQPDWDRKMVRRNGKTTDQARSILLSSGLTALIFVSCFY